LTRVLVFVRHYLPGFRFGGPVRSISNVIEELGEGIDFHIVTSDRDYGDKAPYPQEKRPGGTVVGNALVFYRSPFAYWCWAMACFCKKGRFDTAYFNSFFDRKFFLFPAIMASFCSPRTIILVAPRGEFSSGALAIKPIRKKIYILLFRALNRCLNVQWHATTDEEKVLICGVLSVSPAKVNVAGNVAAQPTEQLIERNPVDPSILRLVFLSRISEKKNLLFALQVLKEVKVPFEFAIYGPIEDERYWGKCQDLARLMPTTGSVNYKGELEPSEVLATLAKYEALFFPTRGENFGHVIAESLLAGTQVLISDQTPWVTESSGSVMALGLGAPEQFVVELEKLFALSKPQKKERRRAAVNCAIRALGRDEAVKQMRSLFLEGSAL
jgi:glycosyltransferase involved in cell wall biosynthesis